MTETESPEPTAVSEAEPTPSPAPEPEPWTPERVLAWNAYYDLYVALGVLLLVFIVSATKINSSSLWPLLQTGRLIAQQGAPVTRDPFSYTELDHPWVNIPWIFEWLNHTIYQALLPPKLARPPGQMTQADQYAAGALVALNAAIRVLTAVLFLSLRRPGPGLWWTALCAMVAVGGVIGPPTLVSLGGIAGQATVSPDTWGLLLMALELVLLYRTLNLGRRNAVFGLIPLFLVWANMDDSFMTGLIVLAAAVIGTIQKAEAGAPKPLPPSRGLAILGGCAAICILNPSFQCIYPCALSPITQLFHPQAGPLFLDQLSVFGPTIRNLLREQYRWYVAYYLILVGIGLGSFFLNRRRFSLSRFLMFTVVSLIWGAVLRYRADFALVFAATLALNGQEWYHDRFGTDGRLGRGWTFWSIGGRAVTIFLVSAFLVKGLTGFKGLADDPVFGFGVNPDLFAFEAADTLQVAEMTGNVLNTTRGQGDALIWRTQGSRKPFIDGRSHLYPPELRRKFEEVRTYLRDDDIARWKPILDEYHITAVMLDLATSPNTYLQLKRSQNWILFYDDGNVVMFGRSDAKDPDLAYFNKNQHDAEALVFRRQRPVESTERPPRLATWFDRVFYDRVFQNRFNVPPQPHVKAARRWLDTDPGVQTPPDVAHCLMAVREARTALARNSDEHAAFLILVEAYRLLMLHEAAILAGQPLIPENINRLDLQPSVLSTRFAQRATALNYAIQTAPPPTTLEVKHELRDLNFEFGQLYLGNDMLDLAQQRLQDTMNLSDRSEVAPEFENRIRQLDEQVEQVKSRLASLSDPAQSTPVQRAQLALSLGATGIAIDELNEADQSAVQSAIVRPPLVDLYSQTGQPDKALEIIGNIDDPALNTLPGGSPRRQGLVSFLIGSTESAKILWKDRAIPQLRGSQAQQALETGRNFLRGDVRPATDSFLELPNRVTTEAVWEMDLGLCLIELGDPAGSAEHLTKALTLWPSMPARKVVEFYLEKLGKTVPALPSEEQPAQETPQPAESSSPPAQPPAPANPPEPARPDTPKAEPSPKAP